MRFFAALLAAVALNAASLPSGIVEAQYSSSLGEIIMITASSNLLHIYDPGSATDTTVPLSYAPLGLSVSPDGYYAAVMHNGWVSYVDLQSHAVTQTFDTGITSGAIVLSGTYIYIFPPSQGGPLCISLSDGSQTSVNAEQASSAQLDPALNAIFGVRNDISPSDLFQITVPYGLPQSFAGTPYQGEYPVCGNLWFSSDGATVYTGCGTAFHASDLTYAGSLGGLSAVQSLAASATKLAAIPASSSGSDTEVRLYESQYLNQVGRFVLPDGAHGKWVFSNQAGTELYVVAEAGSSFELDTIDLASPVTCAASFGSSTNVAVAASGALENASINSGTGCAFQVTSNVNWISVVAGGYGSGDTTLSYVVRPNTTAAQRTGTITLNSGGTLTITQAGWSDPSTGLVNLSVNVVAADYSKALDKLVYVSVAPNELHLYDPATESDTLVPLALAPTSVSVDPTGLYAAVGHDGWISYVALQPLQIQQIFPIAADVNSLALGGNYAYVFPKFDAMDMFALNVSDGGIATWMNAAGGQIPRLDAYANALYVSGSDASEWDFTQSPPVITSTSVPTCGNIWLSEGAAQFYTACATAYSPADFTQNGSLSMAGTAQWVADSTANHSLAVIPLEAPGTNGDLIDSQLQIYADSDLSFIRQLQLPLFQVNGTSYTGHGKYAFWNLAESNLVVVEQADNTAPLISNFGVYVTSTCSYSLSSSSITIPAQGSSGSISISVSASNGCSWLAQPQNTWIHITGGSGTGTGPLVFTVDPNSGADTRTGTITVAEQTVTLSQPPIPAARISPLSLSFGTVQIGAQSSAQTVTLQNTTSAAFSLITASIAGPAASDFPIQANTCAATLSGAGACSVTIAFRPTASGNRTASLIFIDTASGSPQSVLLTGTGAYLFQFRHRKPALGISPLEARKQAISVSVRSISMPGSAPGYIPSSGPRTRSSYEGDYPATSVSPASMETEGMILPSGNGPQASAPSPQANPPAIRCPECCRNGGCLAICHNRTFRGRRQQRCPALSCARRARPVGPFRQTPPSRRLQRKLPIRSTARSKSSSASLKK